MGLVSQAGAATKPASVKRVSLCSVCTTTLPPALKSRSQVFHFSCKLNPQASLCSCCSDSTSTVVQVPYYDYALDMILDADSPNHDIVTDEQHNVLESAAEMLYGLIHVRYILTTRGMSAMYEKYKAIEFGRCPRVLCNGQPALPVGLSDVARTNTVKIYCPKCGDIYYPRYKYQVFRLQCTVHCKIRGLCSGKEQELLQCHLAVQDMSQLQLPIANLGVAWR